MKRGQLLVGWARGDITPPKKTLLMGQFHERLSEGVLSPLTATALAMEVKGDGDIRDGKGDGDREPEQAVFLSCDLLKDSFKDDLLRELEGRCPDLDLRKLTTSCTHTHTAPAMQRGMYTEPEDDPEFMNPDEYRFWLVRRLADIVVEAWEARRPGGVSRGFSYAVVGRCRRSVYADGSALMYGATDREDFIGFESRDDHAVHMLYTHDTNGVLTGMIVNVACPAQCHEQLYQVSADYWHEVRGAVADRFGDHVFLLPQCAPSGDLSPHLLAYKKEECDLRDRLGVDDVGIITRRIMAAVEEGYATASPVETEIVFRHEVRDLCLPRRKVTEEEYLQEKAIPSMSEEELARQTFQFRRIWPFRPISDLVDRYETQSENPTWEMELHVIRVDDAVFATNPFELYVDYGWRIRCRSRALQTFLVQLADATGFYLPTERGVAGGHYSAVTKSNWIGPEGGKVLVTETVRVIEELFEGEEYPETR